jgi:hypothetical protein
MGVDLLRSCYTCKMRFFRDDPRTTDVRWFFTDRPPLPFPTIFTSRNWFGECDEPPLLGEIEPWNNVYTNGSPSVSVPLRGLCGSEQDFAEGRSLPPEAPVVIGDDGFPVCCNVSGAAFTNGFDFGFDS